MKPDRYQKSRALLERAERVIPLGSQTFSKSRIVYPANAAPLFLSHGRGSHVWDVDGNEYVDFVNGLLPVILGYDDPDVTEAVTAQLKRGVTFSLATELEIELAELLCELIPCAERVRFGKNGSDATSGAIRIARAYTGRDRVAVCGYHGWQDWYIGTTLRSAGVPQTTRDLSHTFGYNDVAALEAIFARYPGQIAGVIVESIGFTMPENDFLGRCRDIAHENGALLIFDEIVNGFRLAPGGGGQHFGVTADLIAFGKAVANGAPISVVGGNSDVMRVFDEIFFSTTFGGDTIGIVAALATIDAMAEHDGYSYLWRQGERLKQGFNQLIARHGLAEHVRCRGLPHHTVVDFIADNESQTLIKKSLFQQECLKRGVLFLGIHFTSLAHTDAVIDETLSAYDEAMGVMAKATAEGDYLRYLMSEPVKPVFRSRV